MKADPVFFHPDFNCRYWSFTNSAPHPKCSARGLYRRSGISPCPEDRLFSCGTIIAPLCTKRKRVRAKYGTHGRSGISC